LSVFLIIFHLQAEEESMEAGDVVFDIQTDKAVVSMEADEDGVLAKTMKSADFWAIKIGEVIAVGAEDGEVWKTFAAGGGDAGEAVAPPPAAANPAAATGGSTVVNMSRLSPTMTEGTIVKWYKEEGEDISAGDELCDIQTDKAVVSMECDDDGVVAKILMVEEDQNWKDEVIPAAEVEVSTPSSPPSAVSTPAPSFTRQATRDSPEQGSPRWWRNQTSMWYVLIFFIPIIEFF
jgi:pyruvate/2-oxoglutarate dehydrogenase complex dihydrolipoamide acyltransferase (E2) component